MCFGLHRQVVCLSKFLQCTAHIFLFLTLFKEKLCVLACVSKLLAWTVITCVEKMLSFGCVCSMVMGLLKRVSYSLQNILPFNQ